MKQNNSKLSRARIAASMGILAFAILAACDPEGGFVPPDQSSRPELQVLVMAPDSATMAGDSVTEGRPLFVGVQAEGVRGLEQVRLAFTGAMVKDTIVQITDPTAAVVEIIRVPVPFGTGPDSILYVEASVIDAGEIESDTADDAIFVVDATPPTVEMEASRNALGSGDVLDVTVTAADTRGLLAVGYAIVDEATGEFLAGPEEVAVPAGSFQYTHTFSFTAPDRNPTTLQVAGYARDRNGLAGASSEVSVQLEDRLGPALTIIETIPDSTIPLGDSVQIMVEASDPAGIQRLIFVGQAARGDTLLGTDVIVTRFDQFTIQFPRPGVDTIPQTVVRAPFLYTTDDSTSEAVTMIVLAEDAFGNVSEATRAMFVGGPDVSLVYPTKDVAFGLGETFQVQVRISDGSGIDSAKVIVGGDFPAVYPLSLPARTDTPFVVLQSITLPTTESNLTLHARAWNRAGVGGTTRSINIAVLTAPPADIDPPVVSLSADMLVPLASRPRMELNDTLRIRVSARDEGSAGLQRMGFKAIASRAGAQHVITEDTTFASSHNLETFEFAVPLDSLYARFGISGAGALDSIMPDDIDLRIHAFAADAGDALACSVGIEESRTCNPSTYSDTQFYEAADSSGLLLEITAIRGHTVLLDNTSALIADLAIDTAADRVFLSNISENLIEMLQLAADPDAMTFLNPVQVGSRPWGVFIGERVVSANEPADILSLVAPGDTVPTLIVGNSGGTNMSLVHLDAAAANVQEVDVVRLRTPNAVLFEIEENTDEFGNIDYLAKIAQDFSDRPQFLAQDSLLRIVYSTIPTSTAPYSTVRFVLSDPDPTQALDQPEARFLLNSSMVDGEVEDVLALANIDSLQIMAFTAGSDEVRLFTHQPGYPDSVIYNTTWRAQVSDAVNDLIAEIDAVMSARGALEEAPNYYPFFKRGAWIVAALDWSDTTFISASGDRGTIAIGEGPPSGIGSRIMLWDAALNYQLSSTVDMADLISNASEQVLGVGLNYNGSLGVARGAEATYFFTDDLRLQGLYEHPDQGGAGAVFHPDHDSPSDGGHVDPDGAGVAFTGTPTRSIDVVNTFHFNLVTELHIRDNIVGPLRAGPPLAADNNGQGSDCTGIPDRDCVVTKLYGITDAGGVVIVNVRRKDIPLP